LGGPEQQYAIRWLINQPAISSALAGLSSLLFKVQWSIAEFIIQPVEGIVGTSLPRLCSRQDWAAIIVIARRPKDDEATLLRAGSR